jgi:hypothetical protein
MLVAAITALPLSLLYEWGRRTIWAPALVHTAIDSVKPVDIPATDTITFSLLLVAVSVVVPLSVLLLPRPAAVRDDARRGPARASTSPDRGPSSPAPAGVTPP